MKKTWTGEATREEVVRRLAGGTAPVVRVRRGKVVVIPERWRGRFPWPSTVRTRDSKSIRKLRTRYADWGPKGHPSTHAPRSRSRRKNVDADE